MKQPLPTPSPYRLCAMTYAFRGRKHWTEGWSVKEPETFNNKVAALEAVEPAVFNKLMHILQLNIGGESVRNLAHLDQLLDGLAESNESNEGGYEASLPRPHFRVCGLYFADVLSSIYWPRLINLINDSRPEHEQQIRGFFNTVMEVDLDEHLSIGQLPFDVPEDLRHTLPRQAFSGIEYILDAQSGSWLREDKFSSAYELRLTRREEESDGPYWVDAHHTIAHTGTLEEALMLASLHLQHLNPYFESITAMREAQETLETPIKYRIFTGPRLVDLVLESKIIEQYTDADERSPDPSLRKMIRYDNTWQRRTSAEDIPSLQQENQQLEAQAAQAWAEGRPGIQFSYKIEYNNERIRMSDFCVPNKVLEKMIFDTDKRLGNMHHLANYFSADLGL